MGWDAAGSAFSGFDLGSDGGDDNSDGLDEGAPGLAPRRGWGDYIYGNYEGREMCLGRILTFGGNRVARCYHPRHKQCKRLAFVRGGQPSDEAMFSWLVAGFSGAVLSTQAQKGLIPV